MAYTEITQEQKDQIIALFETCRIEPPQFTFRQDPNTGYFIKVEQMYNYVRFVDDMSALRGYMRIAEILGVKDGDEVDRDSIEGCETCDYGSSYKIELRFW